MPVPPHQLVNAAKREFKRWYPLPDDTILDFVWAVIAASGLDEDPVWGGIVGASGDTKTEILRTFEEPNDREDHFVMRSHLSEHALISGMRPVDNEGIESSLLNTIDGKMLIVKDLTTILKLPTHARERIFAQLRDIYDGFTTAQFGVGPPKKFRAKFGMLFAVTNYIERFWGTCQELGERFIYYRAFSNFGDRDTKITAALENVGNVTAIRDAVRRASQRVVLRDFNWAAKPTDADRAIVKALTHVVSLSRVAVEGGDIYEYLPEPEIGTRLSKQLDVLGRGYCAVHDLDVWTHDTHAFLRRVALGSIPSIRFKVIARLARVDRPHTSAKLAADLALNTATINKACRDLSLGGVVEVHGSAHSGTGYSWRLTDHVRELCSRSGLLALLVTYDRHGVVVWRAPSRGPQ